MKPLVALFLVCVIDLLGFGILIPLIPYMGDRFGAAPELLTPILGTHALCQLCAAPLWGRLSDRFGRRPILMITLAGACVSYLILGMATSLGWLIASRIIGGVMAGNVSAAFAYASDVSTPQNRAAALGTVGAAIGVGFMLGPAIGGLLAGDDPATADFMRPAIVAIALSLLAIALVAFVLPESLAHEQRTQTKARGWTPIWAMQLLGERRDLRRLTIASLLVTIAQAILESIFAIWALARYGFGPRTVGLLLFGLALVAVAMQGGFVRVLAPRVGEHRLAGFGIGAYVAGLLCVAWAPTLALAIVGFILIGAGAGAFMPSNAALASQEADKSDRGTVMGVYQAGASLGRVIGPFVSGPVFSAFGASAPFIVGAAVSWCAALFVRSAGRDRTADAAG